MATPYIDISFRSPKHCECRARMITDQQIIAVLRRSDFITTVVKKWWIFSVRATPRTLCPPPQLQSTCRYIVNHHVKIWQVRLGGANNMRPLNWGGGTNKKDQNGTCTTIFISWYALLFSMPSKLIKEWRGNALNFRPPPPP